MATIFVSIGSNLNPEVMVQRAVRTLREEFDTVTCSPVYRSAAVGFEGAPFLNLVCRFYSDLPVAAVDHRLHQIEDRHGRRRDCPRFSSRTLDLDLLLYDRLCLQNGKLNIPRDEITRYAFVLRPLADLAPDLKHPVTGTTMKILWQAFEAHDQQLDPVPLAL